MPEKAHVSACSKCFRIGNSNQRVCQYCKGICREHDIIQLRVGDDTGMLDVIVCDGHCVKSLLSLITEEGSNKWSKKYGWIVPKAAAVSCKPYIDCIIVSYKTPSNSVRYKIVSTEFEAATDE